MASEVGKGHQGWFEEPFDDRDKMFPAPADDFVVQTYVNLWTQYPGAKIQPYQQFSTNTCVANATAAALWYELKLTGQSIMDTTGPSRLFVYWNARISEPNSKSPPANDGSYVRLAMRSLGEKGNCQEAIWPFTVDHIQKEPGADVYNTAEVCRSDVYWRLDPARPVDQLGIAQKVDDGKETLLRVRRCLSQGYPMVFGFKYYWHSPPWTTDAEDGTWMLPDIWADGIVKEHEKPGNWGGHCIIMIGYNDAKQIVICQNSWGSDPSKPGAGLFYMPYRWILDYDATSDFWTLRHNISTKS